MVEELKYELKPYSKNPTRNYTDFLSIKNVKKLFNSSFLNIENAKMEVSHQYFWIYFQLMNLGSTSYTVWK